MAGRVTQADVAIARVGSARLTAWRALSDLFLDIELSDENILNIARNLRSTGFGVAELERIYQEEVAPACWHNTRAIPGGVWNGFQRRWLVDAIQRRQRNQVWWQRVLWVKRRLVRHWTALSNPGWERVRQVLKVTLPLEVW